MLKKKPGFTLAAVLCLALGAGANVTVFGLVNAVLFRAMPGIKQPDRLVAIGRTENGDGFDASSYPNYRDYRDRSETLSGVACYRSMPLSLSAAEFTERVQGAMASGDYFSVLGVDMSAGRALEPQDDNTPGGHPVAVISHGLWQSRFGSDPATVGQTINLNAHQFTIVGVAAAGFKGTEIGAVVDVWVPLMMQPQMMPRPEDILSQRDASWLQIIGRLKPTATLSEAQQDLELLASQLKQAYPAEHGKTQGIRVSSGIGLDPADREEASLFLGIIMLVAGLVLVIACANIAGLLLVRVASRRREIAIRLAMGATRGRIISLFLVESMMLALAGTAAGWLVSLWARDGFLSLFSQALSPAGLDLSLDLTVVGFTAGLSIAAGLLFGLPPALQASKPDLIPELKDATAVGGFRQARLQRAFLVAQIAMSTLLLISAGLLVRTLEKVSAIDPGFEVKNLLAVSLDLKAHGYDEEKGRSFYQQLTERVAGMPGVTSASLGVMLPLGWGSFDRAVFIDGHPPQQSGRPLTVDNNIVTSGYLETMRIPLLAGRDFDSRDGANAAGTVIINETMARRFWPNESPIGKRFEVGGVRRAPVEIIGVARDTKHRTLQEEPRPVMYLPFLQHYNHQMVLHARTSAEPSTVLGALRDEVGKLDPSLPIFEIKTLAQRLSESIWPQRTMGTLVSILGILALLLAAMGLYGTVSHSVAQRTREIGVRIALGAQADDVMRLVLRNGMGPALLGVIVGLASAVAGTRIIASLLYGVNAQDPVTFLVIAFLLGGVALIACYIPARKAAKVDPMVALRYE
jgi:predicted permease